MTSRQVAALRPRSAASGERASAAAPDAPSGERASTGTADAAHEERDLAAQLRAAGLRVTAPRLAVLVVIHEHQHAGADAIAAAVRERLGTVSTQAVYDVLHALTGAGLVRRISLDDRRYRYELHRHDNHHHLVCRVCGRIEDVACAVGSAPCLTPEDAPGFALEQADVIYRGVCAQCQAPPTPAAA